MNEVEIIKGAREMLSDPAHWVQGAWCSEDQVCLEGALARAAGLDARALLAYREDARQRLDLSH